MPKFRCIILQIRPGWSYMESFTSAGFFSSPQLESIVSDQALSLLSVTNFLSRHVCLGSTILAYILTDFFDAAWWS